MTSLNRFDILPGVLVSFRENQTHPEEQSQVHTLSDC